MDNKEYNKGLIVGAVSVILGFITGQIIYNLFLK